MGNIYALRDWGHAKDYVRMQWLMLQKEEPEDFVIATGVQHRVRQFIEKTASALDMQSGLEGKGGDEVGYWDNKPIIKIDPNCFCPSEVHSLIGDSSKAREKLGWVAEITLDDMVTEMIAKDFADAKKIALLQMHGFLHSNEFCCYLEGLKLFESSFCA